MLGLVVAEDWHARAAILLLSDGLSGVLALVEVREEAEEEDAMETDPDHETARVIALGEEQLELVQHYEHELHL